MKTTSRVPGPLRSRAASRPPPTRAEADLGPGWSTAAQDTLGNAALLEHLRSSGAMGGVERSGGPIRLAGVAPDRSDPAETEADRVASSVVQGRSAEVQQSSDPEVSLQPDPAATQAMEYTVQWGDTLWAIAERLLGDGARFVEIARRNGISDPDRISAGQVLIIEGAGPAPPAEGGTGSSEPATALAGMEEWGVPGMEEWGVPGMEEWGVPGAEEWGIPGAEEWGLPIPGLPGMEEWGLPIPGGSTGGGGGGTDIDQGEPVATLSLEVNTATANRSEMTPGELAEQKVGHAWISLAYHDRAQVPPDVRSPTRDLLASGGTKIGFYAAGPVAPGVDVPGKVVEPDTIFTAKGTKRYEIDQGDVDSLLAFVDQNRSHPYNLTDYNCTTFAVEAVEAAGESPPPMDGPVCMPNELYEGMYDQQKAGDTSVTTAPLEPGETHE